MKYVSDIIGDSYKAWLQGQPIVIEAPTGSGKTHFVLHELLSWAAKQEKKIVYLSNRTALKLQVDKDIQKSGEQSKYIKTLNYQQFSNLSLSMNYWAEQSMSSKGLSPEQRDLMESSMWVYSADYLILDEAHFFLADAGFNLQIAQCLQQIKFLIDNRKDIVWVFMTATTPYLWFALKSLFGMPTIRNPSFPPFTLFYPSPESPERNPTGSLDADPFQSVSVILAYREHSQLKEYFNCYMEWYERFFDAAKRSCLHYPSGKRDAQPDSTFASSRPVHPVYYDTYTELIRAIDRTPEDEKWLIFVESKQAGETLRDMLHQGKDRQCQDNDGQCQGGKNAVTFISTENRRSQFTCAGKAFQEIAKKQRFPCRILIATKVLDNGVSLHDPRLKHIAIDSLEKTEFMQMLGRKRFEPSANESVNLYLRNHSEGAIKKHFHSHILPFVQFHFEFERAQYKITGGISGKTYRYEDPAYSIFLSKYSENGHYKGQFRPYVQLDNPHKRRDSSPYKWSDDSLGYSSSSPTDAERLIIAYSLTPFTNAKLAYNYYSFLALFEKAKNERDHALKELGFYDGKDEHKDESKVKAHKKAEKQLADKQFTWLKEQLRWIGKEYDETCWITYVTGTYQEQRDQLQGFLARHNEYDGLLTEDEENQLKQLFRAFMQEVKPIHPDAKSKGSLEVINRCLKEFEFPYFIESKRETRFGRQRRWWHIRPAPLTQSTEK